MRAGLEELPGRRELLWSLAEVLIEKRSEREALEAIQRLRDAGFGAAETGVLTARLMAANDTRAEAAAGLQVSFATLVSQITRQRDPFRANLALRAGLLLA